MPGALICTVRMYLRGETYSRAEYVITADRGLIKKKEEAPIFFKKVKTASFGGPMLHDDLPLLYSHSCMIVLVLAAISRLD